MDPKDGRAHRAARRAQRSFQEQAINASKSNSTDQANGTSDSPVEEDIDEDDLVARVVKELSNETTADVATAEVNSL